MRRKITDVLQSWKNGGAGRGLLISGARQIGKTYSIDEFCRRSYDNYLRLDFSEMPQLSSVFEDSISADDIFRSLALRFPGFDPEGGVLFMDEIQLCPDARSAIKPLVSDGRCHVIASGSLLGVMGLRRSDSSGIFWNRHTWTNEEFGEFTLNDSWSEVRRIEDPEVLIRETLDRGRRRVSPLGYEETIVMHPMDFEEYLWALGIGEDVTSSIRRHIVNGEPFDRSAFDMLMGYYRQYVVVGGMPKAVSVSLSGGMIDVRREQSIIRNGYFEDLMRYAPSAIKVPAMNCFRSIPDNLKRRNKRFRFSGVDGRKNVGWREYADPLSWLGSSGTVTICSGVTEPRRPLASNVGREFKVYMGDTGLLMSMLDPGDVSAFYRGDTSINAGGITENSVANMLRDCGLQLHYYSRDRTEDGVTDRMQIDFVTGTGAGLAAIEVKSGNTRRSRSMTKLMNDPRTKGWEIERFIRLAPSNVSIDDSGVEHYPLFAAAFFDSLFETELPELMGPVDLRL